MKKLLYTRPNKPRTISVQQRRGAPAMACLDVPEVVAVAGDTECHVTPDEVAAYMVDCLDLNEGHLVLEPHAGTGALINALYDAGHSRDELTAIELNQGLCGVVSRRFKDSFTIEPRQECFLAYAERTQGKIEFPRIILNPPFRKIKQHMNAALSLLGRAGHRDAVLVALVPVTYDHDEAELCDILANDTFQAAKVNTKIIRVVR